MERKKNIPRQKLNKKRVPMEELRTQERIKKREKIINKRLYSIYIAWGMRMDWKEMKECRTESAELFLEVRFRSF